MLYLTEDDVRSVLTMTTALEAVEQGLRKLAIDEAVNVPRTRCQTDHAMLHVMSAAAKSLGVIGYKAYLTTRQGTRFRIALFDGRSGDQLAQIEADYLGQVRTGAATGVATKAMARADATRVGVFGAGQQARTQLEAVCHARPITAAVVYSPRPERRAAFADEMAKKCGITVTAVDTPEQAAVGQDIVITATTSREPVLRGAWLSPGTHVNAVGANFLGKAEVDVETLTRANLIIVDNKEQCRQEAGDLLPGLEAGLIHWADIHELGHVLVGRYPGRESPQDVTLFKSVGLAIEDIAVAARVYQQATAAGIGRRVDYPPASDRRTFLLHVLPLPL